MSSEQPDSTLGATPGKLALIGVLAVVLGGVMWLQPGEEGAVSLPLAPRRPVVAVRPPQTPGLLAPPPAATVRGAVPSLPLADVVGHDPFRLPRALAPPEPIAVTPVAPPDRPNPLPPPTSDSPRRREQERILAALRDQGVSIVFETGGRHVALIGEHTIREGDLLAGFRVVHISRDGVTLEADPGPPADPLSTSPGPAPDDAADGPG